MNVASPIGHAWAYVHYQPLGQETRIPSIGLVFAPNIAKGGYATLGPDDGPLSKRESVRLAAVLLL